MPYYSHFFAMPAGPDPAPRPDPDRMAAFIAARGRKVGEIEFASGGAFLFYDAVEELTGLPATSLLNGTVFDVDPTETSEPFGGLDRATAEALVSAISGLLDGEPARAEDDAGPTLEEAATESGLKPDVFRQKLSALLELLREALADGGEPATIYG